MLTGVWHLYYDLDMFTGLSKTIDSNQIKMKIPNPSQEPPESPKAPNQDL